MIYLSSKCIYYNNSDIARKKFKEPLSEKILLLLEFYCRGSMDLAAEC